MYLLFFPFWNWMFLCNYSCITSCKGSTLFKTSLFHKFPSEIIPNISWVYYLIWSSQELDAISTIINFLFTGGLGGAYYHIGGIRYLNTYTHTETHIYFPSKCYSLCKLQTDNMNMYKLPTFKRDKILDRNGLT